MQPTPATFTVWLPIFATSLAHAAFQALPGRADDPVLRAVGPPAAVAYAATAFWAPLVRSRRYWPAQSALFAVAAAAEVARRRVAAAQAGHSAHDLVYRFVAPPSAMLAAWGAAASAVNLAAMLVAEGPVRDGRPARVTGAALALATAAVSLTAATSAPGGTTTGVGRTYLATVAWALGGIAVGRRRSDPIVASAAAAGLLPVAAAALRDLPLARLVRIRVQPATPR